METIKFNTNIKCSGCIAAAPRLHWVPYQALSEMGS